MADYIYENSELKHYGIPGMKWGVRKAGYESSGGRWPSKKKVRSDEDGQKKVLGLFKKKRKLSDLSDDEIKARLARIDLEKRFMEADTELKAMKSGKAKKQADDSDDSKPKTVKKKLSEVSDDELRGKIVRMELEKRYKQLAAETQPQKSHEARDYVLNIVKKIGENTLTDLGTQAATSTLGDIINKMAGVESTDAAARIVNPRKNQVHKK